MPAMSPVVTHVCTVESLFSVAATGIKSGIHKRPREDGITLLRHGVLGDVQGDREHHGGLFKAVYAFASETREALAEREGRTDMGPGFFGENLATRGYDVDEVVIGTRVRIGTAELEASVPRTPCATLAAWVGTKGFGRRFTEFGKCGAYFLVVSEGTVAPGDGVEVLGVPEHGVSIGEFFRGLSGGLDPERVSALLDWFEAEQHPIYTSMARTCRRVLAKAGIERSIPEHLVTDGRGN